jgi:flagellar protein FlaJ
MAAGAGAETPGGLSDLTTVDSLAALLEAYDRMDVSVGRYLLLAVTPAALVFVLALLGGLVLPLPLLVRLPIPLLGALIFGAVVVYPKLRLERERREMEDRLHLVITHMTVLSTTNIDRMEVFRTLGREEEYGALATEIRRVVQLVDTWNQSLDDACRIRAAQVTSKPVSDFLDRLAYSLGAGQELKDFLLSEQEVIIQNYVTVYQGALDNLEVMKDLYLSMILSMTFALVFATVLPILTGTDPTMTVSAVIVLFVFVQSGFAFAIRTVSPTDPLWYHPGSIATDPERRLRRTTAVGAVLAAGLVVLAGLDMLRIAPVLSDLWPGGPLPMPLYAAIPVTPLVVPGLAVRAEEGLVRDRDGEFPSFIRALGASESAKQSTSSAVLAELRRKDFGALTPAIDDLYKRLNMRIGPARAWRFFAAECRSNLIQKFSEMYLFGRRMGGDPKMLGELISENMNEALQLRERRTQTTITMIGLLYGITAAATFAFFIGLEVVAILSELSLDLNTDSLGVGQLIHTGVYDIPTIEFLLVAVILYNGLVSALMIRTIDGGHKLNAYVHFVALTWIAALVAVLTRAVTASLLSV